ncbi:uncharacterized protein I206_102442 [Kwoniella pini CBS 10737]|uniref:Uncharacterized protein n=1 Tax=Kwoniella pini CBS 10737 TaxID=1296096 RepID=A0A1B9I5E1_9TREE|nr:uncharacterized protein I206_02791 [Kwoniella pini CBS 10737]OCF50735.1 hypothetical protein I206_02791 [Kwoniella pini CBS 10737]
MLTPLSEVAADKTRATGFPSFYRNPLTNHYHLWSKDPAGNTSQWIKTTDNGKNSVEGVSDSDCVEFPESTFEEWRKQRAETYNRSSSRYYVKAIDETTANSNANQP